ncbi:hypothetical protein [Nocardioides sp.]|uniref:hypothetical protein n=1 Tax=Nocardioides sp. TaxID=35761 RepID=UPI002723544B|nr:hypothetical protein [Nocardioides sp.]MDO9455601.1 hypothetical protein [Nocardioides sp.]
MRRTLGPLTLVLAVIVVLPTAPGDAAPPTCQGQRATVVGAPAGEDRIEGTAGRDVVVTAGAGSVDTRGGADLVCVTNPRGRTDLAFVRTGDGPDRVVAVGSSRRSLDVTLGPGSDRFSGGPGDETVATGAGEDTTSQPDTTRDVVDTRGGDDTVMAQGRDGVQDVIRLGAGDDQADLRPLGMTGPGFVDGGPGTDSLGALADAPGALVIDVPEGRGTRDGQPWLRFAGTETFSVYGAESLRFVGGPGPQTLVSDGRAEAAMGAGDDVVDVLMTEPGTLHRLAGGAGTDLVKLYAYEGLTVNLQSGTAVTARTSYELAGMEAVTAAVPSASLVMRGSSRDERLRGYGCRSTRIIGLRGDDRLTVWRHYCPGTATEPSARVVGGPGDDVLQGGRRDDVLLGGPGLDRADGRAGRDICQAERRVRCER